MRAESLAYQNLIGEGAVDVRGVKEGDAKLDGAMDGGNRFGVVRVAVELRHAPASEADSGDGQSLVS
jgi:hypothetical protein